MDQNSQNVLWINNSRAALAYLDFVLFLSFLDDLYYKMHVLFYKKVW